MGVLVVFDVLKNIGIDLFDIDIILSVFEEWKEYLFIIFVLYV